MCYRDKLEVCGGEREKCKAWLNPSEKHSPEKIESDCPETAGLHRRARTRTLTWECFPFHYSVLPSSTDSLSQRGQLEPNLVSLAFCVVLSLDSGPHSTLLCWFTVAESSLSEATPSWLLCLKILDHYNTSLLKILCPRKNHCLGHPSWKFLSIGQVSLF